LSRRWHQCQAVAFSGLAKHKGLIMSSLKTLALAGAVFAGATVVASAADLGYPSPGLPPPPVHSPIAEASGWYLRGDIGIAHQNMKPEIADRRFTPSSVGVHDFSMSKPAFLGIGAGYQFNSWLRADVTAEYRLESRFKFEDKYCFGNGGAIATPGTACSINPGFTGQDGRNYYNGRIASTVFLANAYVDLGTWSGFTPFVGAGVGFAQHKFSGLTDTGINNFYNAGVYTGTGGVIPNRFADKSKTNVAWAVMAGVGYDLSPVHKIELGYRYLNMGKGQQSLACAGGTCGDNINYKNIDAHELKIGLRWMLGGPVFASAPQQVAYPVEPRVIKKF
jgi:opacity protein-like surface antigen